MTITKINNQDIRKKLKILKKDFLKNYDLIWLLEQSLNPGNWEVYQEEGSEGFFIKRNNLVWVNPHTGQELENYYKMAKKSMPIHFHCYKNWVSQYVQENHYKLNSSENIYYHCSKENFKGRKRTKSTIITYEQVKDCKEQWFSKELIDFLKQSQKVVGIIEDDILVGWCYIDTLTKGVAEVYKIETHPMRRRRGYAIDILSNAMGSIFDEEENVMFNVNSNNEQALGLLTKLGFKELGREYRLYLYE